MKYLKHLLIITLFALFSLRAEAKMSNQEIIMNSWRGQLLEELMTIWGKAPEMLVSPNDGSFIFRYTHYRTEYVPAYETSYTNKNGERKVTYHPAETKIYECTVRFDADANRKITDLNYRGNACGESLIVPYHISPLWLEAMKEKQLLISPFSVKETKEGDKKIVDIRKDTFAYKAGLRNGDYVLEKTAAINEREELQEESCVVNRKKGFFSREYDRLTFTFLPTYHSEAYELMNSTQRNLWNVQN
jgi:hypothetical protein